MRIITRNNVTPPSVDLRDGKRHEMRSAGGRYKTDSGHETRIVCAACSSEYAVDDQDWLNSDFLIDILARKFRCPVCSAKWPRLYYWRMIVNVVHHESRTAGELAAQEFFRSHDVEFRVESRIDRVMERFSKEIRDEFGVKDDELESITDPITVSMVFKLCRLGERVKALEAAIKTSDEASS